MTEEQADSRPPGTLPLLYRLVISLTALVLFSAMATNAVRYIAFKGLEAADPNTRLSHTVPGLPEFADACMKYIPEADWDAVASVTSDYDGGGILIEMRYHFAPLVVRRMPSSFKKDADTAEKMRQAFEKLNIKYLVYCAPPTEYLEFTRIMDAGVARELYRDESGRTLVVVDGNG